MLIVGAGPAGAIAALVLARAGVRVRVLDRARFPRFKLCGDSVNPGALAILTRLGLAAAVDGALAGRWHDRHERVGTRAAKAATAAGSRGA